MKASIKPVQDGLLVMIASPAGGFYIRYVESISYYYEKFVALMNINETTELM